MDFEIRPSPVHGRGVFSCRDISRDGFIGCVIIKNTTEGESGDILTYEITGNLGRWLNHSPAPNAYLQHMPSGYYLMALNDIKQGEEIFIDYTTMPGFINQNTDFQ